MKAGIDVAPCIVVDMTDEEAFFELVRGNDQSDIAPLELGLHALKYSQRSQGGRGKRGGVREYARGVGRPETAVRRSRNAAEVVVQTAPEWRTLGLGVVHLEVIHRAPRDMWPVLVDGYINNKWTVERTELEVKAILDAENAKLEAAEREAKEEADAKAFIEAKSPELAKQVESGVFQSFAEAQGMSPFPRLDASGLYDVSVFRLRSSAISRLVPARVAAILRSMRSRIWAGISSGMPSPL